jgi:Piwi domain
MKNISLNFLPFKEQDFGITVYRKVAGSEVDKERFSYYDLANADGTIKKYEISLEKKEGYEEFKLAQYLQTGLIGKNLFRILEIYSKNITGYFIQNPTNEYNRRIHFEIEAHSKGKKCVWVEPYFLKSKNIWGILVGFQFLVSDKFKENGKVKIDKDILIASGSLNSKGYSNTDFYLFKNNHIQYFIKNILPQINKNLPVSIDSSLQTLEGEILKQKQHVFRNKNTSNSAYLGLSKFGPLEEINKELFYHFIFLKEDRDFGVKLLKGLRGETYPNQFAGITSLFKANFSNDNIKGIPLDSFDEDSINREIEVIKNTSTNIIPVIITKDRIDKESDRLYYFLKHKFTSAGIPCQVVTKELIQNENAIKYSLSNIALQIFAKGGGKPWKMVPASKDYLIIGIGQSYNIEKANDTTIVKKSIAYSVLTDSSGIFKDIQILSEGVESDENYYINFVKNIAAIINKAEYKYVTIHVPFRLSKSKILDKVVKLIDSEIELNVLVVNNRTDFFGFDYGNNGLVPFESTYVKVASDEFLIWFEGLQFNNPKITKRFSNPLLIKFWYSNKENWLMDFDLKQNLLQDCINLSGANWRGFKSKQLPVSIFYCERIADFIGKFNDYGFKHIEINNLKPWFL